MDEKRTSGWIVAGTCTALVLVAIIGGVFALRDKLLAEAKFEIERQDAEREKLADRIGSLASKLDSLSTAPATNGAALESVVASQAAIVERLDTITARLDALEAAAKPVPTKPPQPVAAPNGVPPAAEIKTPAVVPSADTRALLVAAALSGKPYTKELADWQKEHPDAADTLLSLSPLAESGIQPESELMAELQTLLSAIPATDDGAVDGIAGKLNTHLEGLVRIRKTGSTDPYADIRTRALVDDYKTLRRALERLSEAQRAPFAAWISSARTRETAVTALTKIAGSPL